MGKRINIPNVTGNIVITVTATAIPTTYTITNNLSHCTTNNTSNTVNRNGSYNATISANSGYEIRSIVVTMGGTDISSTVVSGNNMNIPSVTGNVVINVQATAITYTVTKNLPNCTSSNTASSVNKNASYSTLISPNDGYKIDSIIVTMGGTDITSSVVTDE